MILQMKPKGVTTQIKALDKYILMVLFLILLKIFHALTNETKDVTIQMLQCLSEDIRIALFVLLLKSVHYLAFFEKHVAAIECDASIE